MKSKSATLLCSAIAALGIGIAPASAAPDLAPSNTEIATDTYGGCSSGYRYRGSYNHRGGSYYRGGSSHYRGGHSSYRTTTRCRIIDRYYFMRGCYRYCRITYRHETVDCYGRVIRCWTSCKTVRA